MTEESAQQQDIDTGSDKVVNPGKPVEHVDVEDGESVGHSAKPDAPESGDKPVATKDSEPELPAPPPKISRDEIYSRARQSRDAEIETAIENMDADQRKQYDRMVAEAGGGPDPFAEEEEASAEQPPAPDQQAQPVAETPPTQPQQSTETPPESLDNPSETVTVTVYGMREDVPRADVDAAGGIDAYQKNRAADIRMQRLATYEASLREYDSQLQERANRIQRGDSADPELAQTGDLSPTDDPDSGINENELAQEIVRGMFSGDEEAAAEKLSQALAAVRSDATRVAQRSAPVQSPSPNDPDDIAREQAKVRANAVFANEFGDLQTPVLRKAVLDMVNEVAADPVMRGRPLDEITREAGMRVRSGVFGNNQPPQPTQQMQPSAPQPDTDLGRRLELKKRTVVTPMHETGQRYTPPTDDEQQLPSNSEYIALMRKRRNLPA